MEHYPSIKAAALVAVRPSVLDTVKQQQNKTKQNIVYPVLPCWVALTTETLLWHNTSLLLKLKLPLKSICCHVQ